MLVTAATSAMTAMVATATQKTKLGFCQDAKERKRRRTARVRRRDTEDLSREDEHHLLSGEEGSDDEDLEPGRWMTEDIEATERDLDDPPEEGREQLSNEYEESGEELEQLRQEALMPLEKAS